MRKELFGLVGVFAGLMLATAGSVAPSAIGAGAGQNYIVLYKSQNVPGNAAKKIEQAGGTIVYSYDQIGVVIAKSSNPSFASSLPKADVGVDSAAGTARFAVQLEDTTADVKPGDLPNIPATDSDTLTGLQWDMKQIHTPEAHAITGGSPTVVVGDIDTGLDYTHPDLAPNVDFSRSASCLSGAPDTTPTAWQDPAGHGTHTAGTIAAAANGIGIVGVAPNVKIAGIRAGNEDGYFFPEAVVCSFMWAGSHDIDVTNNSYFADPWLFNCKNDPGQRAIWEAEQRAIKFAQKNGVLVVASEGNASEDISHPSRDRTSPDFPPGSAVDRPVTNACIVIPVEIPGVIGVTANGANTQTDDDDDPNDYLKSYYSSFGISEADVVAPGGDRRYGINAAAGALNGRVLSTWPAAVPCPASLTVTDGAAVYCYLQGTSMAGPHVAGVAALIVSQYGKLDEPGDGTMKPGKVSSIIKKTADAQPCPTALPTTNPVDGLPYLAFRGLDDDKVQVCEGGKNHNSWYGDGQVNALSAVTEHH